MGKTRSNHGFTIIELMIVVALVSVIFATVIFSHGVQTESFSTQREIANLQQDLRGALFLMQNDILNAGRDPDQEMEFGITNIGYFSPFALDNAVLAPPPMPFPPINFPAQQLFNSFQALEVTSQSFDANGDGIGDQTVRIRYQVFDFNNDGRLDLGRRVDTTGNGFGQTALVAEGVIAIGYVFAYDQDPDGHYKLTRSPAGCDHTQRPPAPPCNPVWAVDSDGDGDLDTNVDIDGDGEITPTDDTSGDGIIGNGDGNGLSWQLPPPPAGEPLGLRHIRAIRISILLQSEKESAGNYTDRNMYVVGDRVIPPRGGPVNQPTINPFNDGYRRRVKTITVALRNFQKI